MAPPGVTAAPVAVSGWAVDAGSPAGGPGVDAVAYRLCPTMCDTTNAVWQAFAAYGAARPDVAALLGPQYQPSGFSRPVAALAPGPYELVVWARRAGAPEVWTTARTEVVITPSPFLAIEGPQHLQAVTSPFTVSGWAADFAATSGTGIAWVRWHGYSLPGSGQPPTGNTYLTLGGERADMTAALMGLPNFRYVGVVAPDAQLPAGEAQFRAEA